MQDDLNLQAYHYHLPEENIAQHPSDKRDRSRLLVLHKKNSSIEDRKFSEIYRFFQPGDVLVVNDTKVFPARLNGTKETGGKAEVFLLNYPRRSGNEQVQTGTREFFCQALIKSSRPPKEKSTIDIDPTCCCTVLENKGRGRWSICLSLAQDISLEDTLAKNGDIPLPPYINRKQGSTSEDAARYQTVYAEQIGAVAAPTAGLHFTGKLLQALRAAGVTICSLTLHVGYGTFAPVESARIEEHRIHQEYIDIPSHTAEQIIRAREKGGRIWAVGTTTVRALEFAALRNNLAGPLSGFCDLYITPGFSFKVVDNLITNFHLPQTSLMFLVSALCGRKQLLTCYQHAIKNGYRFYSYGDAMAILS